MEMVSVLAEKRSELSALCNRYGVQRLEVFGSAASEEAFVPETSELDFIVEFRANEDLGPWLQKYFDFRDGLSKLFGYPIDLVMASAMKNHYFIREANRTRRLLYGA
jgi:predicted nucleotidyltransferase